MQGQLFSQDFLRHGIRDTPPYQALEGAAFDTFVASLRALYAPFTATTTLNEAQTEALLIEPVLALLGWGGQVLPQVNLSAKRREDVPDMLLFPDAAATARAVAENKDERRYRHGVALLEAKRWLRPLDRGASHEQDLQDPTAPSSQMLRYLSRAEVMSERAVRWGLLTNGAVWRLYWQGARSRAEEFLELDVAGFLGLPGAQPEPDAFGVDPIEPEHGLKLLYVLLHRQAFLPQAWQPQGLTFHIHARQEAKSFEEKVSQDLGQRVFAEVFPALAQALAAGDQAAQREDVGYGSFKRQRYTAAYLEEVREAALVLLYRLLFLFYAEDRRLLPVADERYRQYSVRALREKVRDQVDAGQAWSGTMQHVWLALVGSFTLIDKGDDTIGMPAYNGGLFAWERAPLLNRTRVPDAVMAPLIDALSRRTEDSLRGWINYRDLSVSHLGGIYERLLEYSLTHEVQAEDDYRDLRELNRIVARPASFARKTSGSYYTHDDLVRLVLRESVGILASECMQRFETKVAAYAKKRSLNPGDWDQLDAADPASAMLNLMVCDPAMGSGHFLVSLVDDLADRVLEAVTAAQLLVAEQGFSAHLVESHRPWVSPLTQQVAAVRANIRSQAQQHGWAVTDAQLDDRHIVRRMVLKKSIYGVDKKPMAVELAKTALWLHTFTVGAPLSFLDHHLKLGDSLHGEQLPKVQRGLESLGTLFQQDLLAGLQRAAVSLEKVAELSDADIAQVKQSQQQNSKANAELAPLLALLDFWRALRWLVPGWPADSGKKLARLGSPAEQQALAELLSPQRDIVATLVAGKVEGHTAAALACNELIAKVRALAQRETFFHWSSAFPTVFARKSPGFDAVIGNPPWDRIKLQEVEWFAERDTRIAAQARAADRKALIQDLQTKKDPLAADYALAVERAEANARVLSKSGDYPLLGGGDVNLYSLFVERAQSMVRAAGIVALITPSGIAADKGAAEFFGGIATTGRLGGLFDFENKKVFFPDVHASFKFCGLVFGGSHRRFEQTRCAFFLHTLAELDDPARSLALSAEDFKLVNPNTGAAPIFRSRRDADITMRMYREHPVLSKHGTQTVWPVRYSTTLHMTNDSAKFKTAEELRKLGFRPKAPNGWHNGRESALPLYVGRMLHQYDHRHADVTVNSNNLQNAALGSALAVSEKRRPDRYPAPQYWVDRLALDDSDHGTWAFAFRDIARSTDMRTMIAGIIPTRMAGNTLPLLLGTDSSLSAANACRILANFNSFAFDYVTRQKAQSTHLNWYILEQLPVIAPARFEEPLPTQFTAAMRQAGLMNGHHAHPTVADFVVPQVLALSYTAHDLAPFARDLGYVDAQGEVLPPFIWNEEERRARLAALDALFMHLYGLTAEDAAYVLDSFPIVREQDEKAFGRYRTQEDVLALLPLLTPA